MTNNQDANDQVVEEKNPQSQTEEVEKCPLTLKIESLETELLAASEKAKQAEEQKMRALADLQNFQRRQAEDRMNWSNRAVVDFLKKVLPNFLELSLGGDHSTDEAVKQVIDKFFEKMSAQGLAKITPNAGDQIDVEQHEVLMAAEGEPGTVVACFEPGWSYNGKVIVPAKISGASSN